MSVDMVVVASCLHCDWETEPADATAREQRAQHKQAERHTNESKHATLCGLRPVIP